MEKQIISKFKELPKSKIVWWVFSLGIILILIYIFLYYSTRNMIITSENGNIFWFLSFIAISPLRYLIVILSLILGIKSFKKGERSWVLWLGFFPVILSLIVTVLRITLSLL